MFKFVEYRDVARDRYVISTDGRLFVIQGLRANREIFGCNPNNEKGYVRVTLVTQSGTLKKYPLHRLVLATFIGDSNLEVNHIDGNKLHNWLSNLEYLTGDENKHHASVNFLYRSCEDHDKTVLTDNQVRAACELFEKGYNVRKVVRNLSLTHIPHADKMLERILHRKSWVKISKDYSWDIDDVRLKIYTKEHLRSICQLIATGKFSKGQIADMFPQYDRKRLMHVVGKIRQGKLYKSIMDEVKRSTTIASSITDGNGLYVLVPRVRAKRSKTVAPLTRR